MHVSVRSPAAAASQVLTTSLQSRSRLRRGCHCHAVRSVLYIGHILGRLDSANDAGQVLELSLSRMHGVFYYVSKQLLEDQEISQVCLCC